MQCGGFLLVCAAPRMLWFTSPFRLFLMLFKKSKNGPCTTCRILNAVYLVIGVLVSIASLAGAFKAHFPIAGEGIVVGSTAGSLALLAFVGSLFFVKKMSACCPCQCAVPMKK